MKFGLLRSCAEDNDDGKEGNNVERSELKKLSKLMPKAQNIKEPEKAWYPSLVVVYQTLSI